MRHPKGLSFVDGSRWSIGSGDKSGDWIVSRLADVMKLSDVPDRAARHILFFGDDASARDDTSSITCCLADADAIDTTAFALMQLTQFIEQDVLDGGGVFIHGALAEGAGRGIVLAAPGGTGKTTASRRLPPPWLSWSDDTTLITRDEHGNYWAHPWPTISRFMSGDPAGSWDVQAAVPLTAIFFLEQAAQDRADPVGRGRAVCMLIQSVEQAAFLRWDRPDQESSRRLRLKRFDNVCVLAQSVPAFRLELSLTSAFWTEIEWALDIGQSPLETLI